MVKILASRSQSPTSPESGTWPAAIVLLFILGWTLPCPAQVFQEFSDEPDSVVICAVGDIMAHQTQLDAAWDGTAGRYDFGPAFDYVTDILSAADLTLGNLETTLPGDPKLYSGYPSFGTPDAFASALAKNGFDLLNTANNHCLDKGPAGLRRTLDALDTMGMLHAGTYRTPEEREANRVLFVERNGLKLAFLAFTYAVNGPRVPVELAVNHIDTARIAEDLALASAGGADFTLVLAHFGTEYATEPDSAQIRLVDFLFDRGADVVLGGHPHAVQRYELRTDTAGPKKGRQRLVIYSLGNFLSNQRRPGSDGGVAFFFTLSRAFDAAGSPVKSISSVGHESVWVSVRPEQGTRRFRLLPVRGYLDHYRPFDLPEADIARMREFRKEIEGRLGPGERGPWE